MFGGIKMKKSNHFLTVIAAQAMLVLAIFTFTGCEAVLAQSPEKPDATPGRNASFSAVQAFPAGTVWLDNLGGSIGVSKIEFNNLINIATGIFGDTTHYFSYAYNTSTDTGVLTEIKPQRSWDFSYDRRNNDLIIANFRPYYTGDAVFEQIYIKAGIILPTLAGTNWIGYGPRGESLLDQITVSGNAGDEEGELIGTFGADPPNEFAYTYDYDTSTHTGEGEVTGPGTFTTDAATGTLTFDNFWGHGGEVTFNLFTYTP
jgi:hypothetical protein